MAEEKIVELPTIDDKSVPTDTLQSPTDKTVSYSPYQSGGAIAGWDIEPGRIAASNISIYSGAANTARVEVGSGTNTAGVNSPAAASDIAFWAGATFANRATAPFRVEADGSVVATDATITGSITATSGTIGGFDIGSDYIRDTANSFGLASTVTGGDDVRFWAGDTFANRATAPFRVTEAGVVTGSNITITGGDVAASILSGTVGLSNTNIAAQGWTQTSAFSVTDADTVSWGAGTFTSASGTSYSIGAGNTGNMAARTYIYLDIAVSTTAYQTTTTASTAVGAGKVLVATAINGTNEAEFEVFTGGLNINGSSIVASSITGSEIAANTITASNITAGTITTTEIASNTIVAGNIVAGTITATEIADTTITGAKISDSTITNSKIDGVLPYRHLSTIFETSGRFTQTLDAGATATFDTGGLLLQANGTNVSGTVKLGTGSGTHLDYTSGSSFISFEAHIDTNGTDRHCFIGAGEPASSGSGGITFTDKHYGFKLNRASSSSTNSATNADGTTETATSFTLTETSNTHFTAHKNGTTNIRYYTGTTLQATHTTNLPSSDTNSPLYVAISTVGVNNNTIVRVLSYAYEQTTI